MPQLKLMKKEWFNWFDKTFLANITAWTEYYYINPDSQHWISNNLIQIPDVPETTRDGITYSLSNGVLKFTGTCQWNIILNLPINIPAGTYSANNFGTASETGSVRWELYQGSSYIQYFFGYNEKRKTFTTTRDADYVRIIIPAGTYDNLTSIPILVRGKTIPEVYNPPLIKIEDILGEVNFGSLSWGGSNGTFYSLSLTDLAKRFGKVFCLSYKTIVPVSPWENTPDLSIFLADNYLVVRDDSYNDPNTFKQERSGEYLVYIKKDSPLG